MGVLRPGIGALALALAAVAAPQTAAAHPPGSSGGIGAEGEVKRDLRGGHAILERASDSEVARTRTRFFGAANVDPATGAIRRDRLILSWFGVTNFALAIRGQVVLLDAWVPRGAHSGYVPTEPAELAALAPELIVIGHAHFDHAADAVPIATASGATLVGTAEHCAAMRQRQPALPPACRDALPADAAPGTLAALDLIRGVEVDAVKHLHSAVTGPDGHHLPVAPPPSTTVAENPPTHQDMVELFGHLDDEEGGSVLYRFRVGDFTFVWHDSAGPLSEDAPEALEALRGLRPVDLQVGAIQGFNQLSDGMRDPRSYIEALAPATFVPSHHDDWAAGITTKGENYEQPLADELEKMPAEDRPEVRFIRDPDDYVAPDRLTFDAPLDPLRLRRSCGVGGRLKTRLGGDVADVRGVLFKAPGARAKADRTAPYRARLATRAAGHGGGRLRARVTFFDGSRDRLARRLPRCR